MHQNTPSPQYPAEDAAQPADGLAVSAGPDSAPQHEDSAGSSVSRQIEVRTFTSPGLTPVRRYGTAIMLFALGLFAVGIVFSEHGPLIVSAILGLLLIAGFIWYLRMIAPAPFTLTLTPEGLSRQEKEQEPVVIPWEQIARVKEEQFTSGKIIGIMVYARSTTSVYRALVLWRGDLPGFDAFRVALKASTLPETPWQLETVHE